MPNLSTSAAELCGGSTGVFARPFGRSVGQGEAGANTCSAANAAAKSGEKRFEPGTYVGEGAFVFVRNPEPEELAASYRMLVAEVGADVAPYATVERIFAHNPLSWWVIFRCADETRAVAEAVGLCTYLPLNAEGFAALKRGALNARDPDLAFVAPSGEDPLALYLWAIVAHGLSDIAGKLVGHAIGLDLYERLPMFGTIGTEAGLAALRRSSKSASDAASLKIGSPFEIKLPPHHIAHQRAMDVWEGAPAVFLHHREAGEVDRATQWRETEGAIPHTNQLSWPANAGHPGCLSPALPGWPGPPTDLIRGRPGHDKEGKRRRPALSVRVASSPDDIAKIFALRAAVFMAEQDCPYEEEFDGNDYTGTQILGLVNGAPAATLRIRYFADFVKIERLAVLPRYRRTLIAREIVEFGIGLVRRKGYTRMYGHAQTHLVNFWRKFGFEPMAKNAGRNAPFAFSDRDYVEIAGQLAPHEERLTMMSDPYMLIRPEGRWDKAGVLERSAARETRNPL